MKKGAVISLEALVKLIPHLLITVGLLFILGTLIATFFAKAKTPAEQDFQRILGEFESVVEMKESEYCLRVPIQAKSALDIITYPAKSAPPACQGKSCVCLYETKEGRSIETCKVYSKISDDCSRYAPLCFASINRLTLKPGDTVVTIVKGKGGLLITGPEFPCSGGIPGK